MKNSPYIIIPMHLIILIVFSNISFAKQESSVQNYENKTPQELIQIIEKKDKKIEKLRNLVRFYRKKLEQFEQTPFQGTPASYEKIEAAHRLWQEAWNLQRTAIFKKMGQEKEDMLEEAIEKFRQIVALYPETKEADEAQYRIVRIYDKFLKDHLRAKEERKKYLEHYPRGEFSGVIKEELDAH